MNLEELNLEKFDPKAERLKPFDDKSFDPSKNRLDKIILNRLRTPGKKRFERLAETFRRDLMSIEKYWWQSSLASYCFNWSMGVQGAYVDAGCGESADADLWVELGKGPAYAYDLFPRTEEIKFEETDRLKPYEYVRKSDFLQQNIFERWPNEDGTVAAVGCNAVLDLLTPDQRLAFYKECFRVLMPQGKLTCYIIKLANGHGFTMQEERERMIQAGFETPRSVSDVIQGIKPLI